MTTAWGQKEEISTCVEEEHTELRRRIEAFKTAFTLIRYVGPQTQQSLLWRLITEARAIFARLKTHAGYETQLQRELMNYAAASPGPPLPQSTAPAA